MWIVQEVVLAKKAVIMCSPDEVPWEAIKITIRDVTFSISGKEECQLMKYMKAGSVVGRYAFPNKEYISIGALQEEWPFKI